MPRSRRLLALTLCTLAIAADCHAQGFLAINGRNHPELKWQVAETEHFKIAYPDRIAGIEFEAAAIAEETYRALVANFGVDFDKKIRIYLSDEDENVNGFAVPLGVGHTNIWVNLNDAAEVWTGREKWLRKVIAHELAHIFHYRAVRSNIRPFDALFGQSLPRFWTEGLAQYQTEEWDAYRGERWLRTAVLDDRLSYKDGRSLWNGRLLYSVGNAQVRYFADQFGDSTLVRLLRHRKSVLFGLGKVHDFGTAFEDVSGTTYQEFYDRWRRHINVQYNTVAGTMDTPDSLGAPLTLPGQYIYDIQYAPDTSRIAVLAVESLKRPVRRIYLYDPATEKSEVVAEGAIKPPLAWNAGGTAIAFARRARGDNGSLINDLYLADLETSKTRRLTRSRRASFPAFSDDGRTIAFVGANGGTGNIYLIDVASGRERQITNFSGDNQIARLRWHPSEPFVLYGRFADNGDRVIEKVDVRTGIVSRLTDGADDDRNPVWSPDGASFVFTSMRDGVPNVFVSDADGNQTARLTSVVTGATAYDWLPPDSSHAAGRVVLGLNESKTRDRGYVVDASVRREAGNTQLPDRYTSWMHHRPPHVIPSRVLPDSSLVTTRYRYNSWRNMTHALSLVIPYLGADNNVGIAALTSWTEPLGKHTVFVGGGLLFARPKDEIDFQLAYLNNQFRPRLQFDVLQLASSLRPYADGLLREKLTQGVVTAIWPLDLIDRPYVRTTFSTRLRFTKTRPRNRHDFLDLADLPTPEAGTQADLRLAFTYRRVRPYADNVVHPLDGQGVRLRFMAGRTGGASSAFARGDLGLFQVIPSVADQRLFVYGRLLAQRGATLSQDFIGLSRYDELQILTTDQLEISFSELDRVRGYRRFASGKAVAFGTVEYRIPLMPSLQTTLLGAISLESTTLSLFADGALVYPDYTFSGADRRLGVGAEVKNALSIGGAFRFMHAVGFAQPAEHLGSKDRYEFYYRIRTSLPF